MYITSFSYDLNCSSLFKNRMSFNSEGNSEGNDSLITGMGRNTLKTVRNFYKQDNDWRQWQSSYFPLLEKKKKKVHIFIVKSDRNLTSTVKKTNPMKFLSSNYMWEFATSLNYPGCQKNKKREK